MGMRFSKRIKIAPGLKLNVGLGGASLTAGVRGASINFGKRGAYVNAGIPGTGIFYRQSLSSSSKSRVDRFLAKQLEDQERDDRLSSLKLTLNEDGKLEISGSKGEHLDSKDIKRAYELKAASIYRWLEEQAEKISGDTDLIENIHTGCMDVDQSPEYTTVPFDLPAPNRPVYLTSPIEPTYAPPSPLPGFISWISFLRNRNESKRKKYEVRYKELLKKYKAEYAFVRDKNTKLTLSHEEETAKWTMAKEEHQNVQSELKKEFDWKLRNDVDFMEAILEDAISSLEWPRETLVSYDIRNEGREIHLDIDLPEVEDLPQKVASVAAGGRKLNIKNKAVKTLQLEYLRHISGIALRSACCVMATLPSSHVVIVSGYSQRLDKATGSVNDEYLYSVKFLREGLEAIDYYSLEKVDPVDALGVFEHRRKITATGIIKPIEPFS